MLVGGVRANEKKIECLFLEDGKNGNCDVRRLEKFHATDNRYSLSRLFWCFVHIVSLQWGHFDFVFIFFIHSFPTAQWNLWFQIERSTLSRMGFHFMFWKWNHFNLWAITQTRCAIFICTQITLMAPFILFKSYQFVFHRASWFNQVWWTSSMMLNKSYQIVNWINKNLHNRKCSHTWNEKRMSNARHMTID